jgi:hypothetical protein
LNRDFIARLNNSDLELSVIFGIIQLIDGLELLKTTQITAMKVNQKMTAMDIWFEAGSTVIHRCIDL